MQRLMQAVVREVEDDITKKLGGATGTIDSGPGLITYEVVSGVIMARVDSDEWGVVRYVLSLKAVIED